jgi:hypothetical protein
MLVSKNLTSVGFKKFNFCWFQKMELLLVSKNLTSVGFKKLKFCWFQKTSVDLDAVIWNEYGATVFFSIFTAMKLFFRRETCTYVIYES